MSRPAKLILFIIFISFLVLDLIIQIPIIIKNVIYGIMSIFAIYFLVTNKNELGLNKDTLGINKMFEKKKDPKK